MLKLGAALFALAALVAWFSMQGGNPTAINGVVGASFGCVLLLAVDRYLR